MTEKAQTLTTRLQRALQHAVEAIFFRMTPCALAGVGLWRPQGGGEMRRAGPG
jgi:hypothetical protein